MQCPKCLKPLELGKTMVCGCLIGGLAWHQVHTSPVYNNHVEQNEPLKLYGIVPVDPDHAPDRDPQGPLRSFQVALTTTSASLGISNRYFTTGTSSDGRGTVWLTKPSS